MAIFEHISFDGHEHVMFCHDQASGLKAIIAVHDTTLGPAVGGCRMWPYDSEADAVNDVLRLSRGMTYKNALAGLEFGGGKSVIIGDPKSDKSEALFHAFGRAVDSLGGRYYSAEDVGINTSDIMTAHEVTPYMCGLEGQSGDPSPFTALGTFLGIKAAVKHQRGLDSLEGIKVAVQGLGHVGFDTCRYLHEAGAELVVCDLSAEQLDRAATEFGATIVGLDEIYSQAVDVYCPCALGATINDATIPQLKATIVAGCANNQLAEPRHGEVLKQKGILYAPDYVINAGGIINVSFEKDYDAAKSDAKVRKIYDTLLTIFRSAEEQDRTTGDVADVMAREIIAKARAAKA